MSGMERTAVEQWLKSLGCTPTEQQDFTSNWHLEFDYPPKTPHRMHVASPKALELATVIASRTQISPEHLEAFSNLDEDGKEEFLWDLRHCLNSVAVDFRVEGASGPMDCPTTFQISINKFPDGLTLDSFAYSIGAVYKTELDAIWFVQQHLGGKSYGPGNRFDFKRLGL